MLELDHITRTVGGADHIRDVSLALPKGTLNVLLGPTLAGKTSLMRLMAGLDRPTAGRIVIDGRDVTGVPVRRRNVAMVYQQFINYPAMTVYDNIASPLRLAGLDRASVDREVRTAAHLLHLEPYLDRLPLSLSGGQQQRTALARALVKKADLVLLDEPLANLDYKLREELRAELPRLFAATGAIFVYATTEPSEALLLGGNTATLHEGRISQFGPTIEVYARPRDLVTARAFSDPPLNTVAVTLDGGAFRLPGGIEVQVPARLARLAAGSYVLALRPHHLLLDRPSAKRAASVPARVVVTEITGSESFTHMDCAGSRWVALAAGVRHLEPGAEIAVWFDPERLMVFGADGRRAVDPG